MPTQQPQLSAPLLPVDAHNYPPDNVTEYAPGKIDKGPPSRLYLYLCFCCYCCAFIMLGAGTNSIGPVTPALSQHLGVKTTDMGPVFTALGLSSIVSGLPAGWIVDNVHGHLILFFAMLIEGLGLFFLTTAPTVVTLSLLFGGVALTFNFTNSTVFTLLVGLFPTATTPLNVASSMFGIGSFCVPILARQADHFLGGPLEMFRVLGVLAMAMSVPFLFMPSPIQPLGSSEGSVQQTRRPQGWWTQVFVIFGVMFLLFLVLVAQLGYSSWIFTYSLDYAMLKPDAAAVVNSAFWAALTAGTIGGALFSTWCTPAVLLLVTLPFAIVGTAMPIVMGDKCLQVHWLTIASALVGFGNSTGYANAFALLNRYIKTTGFINGCMCAVAGLGCMVGPMCVALLHTYTNLGHQSLMWMALVTFSLHFPVIILVVVLGRRLKSTQLKRVESIQLLSDLDFSMRSVASFLDRDPSVHSVKSDASGPARFITVVDSL